MKNLIKTALFSTLSTLFAATAATATGAVILEDSFTDPVASHMKWAKSLPDEMMTATVSGGTLSVSNTSDYAGEYYHIFQGAKPSEFTLSFVLKSVSSGSDAGVLFCRGSADSSIDGYYLTARNDTLLVLKYVGGSGRDVYYAPTRDLRPSDNTLAVSKRGSEFNLFLNGFYQGSFTDAQFNSGDVSFFLTGGVSAAFGEFRMTDEFMEGGLSTSFTDNFEGNDLRYWEFLYGGTGPNADIRESGGVLNVSTGGESATWMFAALSDIGDAFTASVEVCHVSGVSNSEYGIILVGERPSPGAVPPIAHFGIRGDRRYGVWRMGEPYNAEQLNMAILGAAPAGVVFVDTIKVVKRAGSSYELFVNNQPLAYSAQNVVNFRVAGVGVFSTAGMVIHFDNFSAVKEGVSSIREGTPSRVTQRPRPVRPNNPVFYDLRGRRSFTTVHTNGRAPYRTAAGVYLNENQRDVLIRKNR